MKVAICLLTCCALLAGCDADRITKLEKENAELKTKLEKQSAAVVYGLQEKCSKDARLWFNQNWERDKNTTLLDFTNHYSKNDNTCYIKVEYHYTLGPGSSWTNNISIWNVYENSKYGDFSESHIIDSNFKVAPIDKVYVCEVYGKKCTSLNEFNQLSGAYLNN